MVMMMILCSREYSKKLMINSYPTIEDDYDDDHDTRSLWIPSGGQSRHTPHPGGSYHAGVLSHNNNNDDNELSYRRMNKMKSNKNNMRSRVVRNVDEEQFDKAMRNAKRRELEMRRVLKSHYTLVERLNRQCKLSSQDARREMRSLLKSATEWQMALEKALEDHRSHILHLHSRHEEALLVVGDSSSRRGSTRNLKHELIVSLIREAKGRDIRLGKALTRHRRGLEYLQREATLLMVKYHVDHHHHNEHDDVHHTVPPVVEVVPPLSTRTAHDDDDKPIDDYDEEDEIVSHEGSEQQHTEVLTQRHSTTESYDTVEPRPPPSPPVVVQHYEPIVEGSRSNVRARRSPIQQQDHMVRGEDDVAIVASPLSGYISLSDLYRELGGHREALLQVTNAVQRMLNKGNKSKHNNKRRYNAEGGNSMYRVRQWQRALDEANDHVEVLIKNREGGHEQRSQKERDTVDTGGRGNKHDYRNKDPTRTEGTTKDNHCNGTTSQKNNHIILPTGAPTIGDFHKHEELQQQETARFGSRSEQQLPSSSGQKPRTTSQPLIRPNTFQDDEIFSDVRTTNEVVPKDYVSTLLEKDDDGSRGQPPTLIDKSKIGNSKLKKEKLVTNYSPSIKSTSYSTTTTPVGDKPNNITIQ